VGAEYLRLIWKNEPVRAGAGPTSTKPSSRILPVIVAMWHGQHFLMPFIKLKQHKAKMLISASSRRRG
jgi:lysophospholipid acyltransferase (LPLAT)-like uncharacterized protein